MASDASHVLEAALEQMDGIIAGMLRGPGYLHTRNHFPLIGLLFWVQRQGPCWISFMLLCVCALF